MEILPSSVQEIRHKQLKVVLWLRIFVVIAIGLTGVATDRLLGVELPWGVITFLGAALLSMSLLTFAKLRARLPVGRFEIAMQLFADLSGFSILLYFSGGVTNPFVALYLPLLGLAAALLPITQVSALAAVSVCAYSVLMQEYVPLVLSNPAEGVYFHLVGMWLNFLLSVVMLVAFVARFANGLRKHEHALRVAQDKLLVETRMAAIGNLSASLAHQLGSPLATLRVVIQDLKTAASLSAFEQDIDAMNHQLNAMEAVLQELRKYVEPTVDRAAIYDHKSMGFQAAFELALREWRNVNPDQLLIVTGLGLRSEAHETVSATLLTIALHAVLDNAREAHKHKGLLAPIDVSLEADATTLRVHVQDRGGGMSAKLLSDFGQSPVRDHGRADRHGMGLFLISNLLEREGSCIQLHNREGGLFAALIFPRVLR
jgi:two-component system, sensor histidine kinase RegB